MPSTATSILDGLSTSVAVKAPCRTVATTNITLAGLQTISGYTTVENDRVLVKGQTDPVENGIYMASTGNWTRAKDADGNRDLVQGTRVIIRSMTAVGAEYELTTENPIVIGTTALTWTLRYGANATYDQTEAEIAAGVTPVNDEYLPGHVFRYKSGSRVADGTVDWTTAINNALLSNQRVYAPSGSYLVTSPLLVRPYTELYGDTLGGDPGPDGNQGGTVFLATTDIEIIASANDDDEPLVGVRLHDFTAQCTVADNTTKYQIHLTNPVLLHMERVHTKSGLADTNYSATNVAGVWIEDADPTLEGPYINRFAGCFIQNGGLIFSPGGTDSTIIDNFIYGHCTSHSLKFADGGGNFAIIGNNFTSPPSGAGIEIAGGTENQYRIIGNFFDGNPTALDSGHGLLVTQAPRVIFANNHVWAMGKSAVRATDPVVLIITDNIFQNCNDEDDSWSDVAIVGDTFQPTLVTVIGNHHQQESVRSNAGYAIDEQNDGFNPISCTYKDNKISDNYLTTGTYGAINTLQVGVQGAKVTGNTGGSSETEAVDEFTITLTGVSGTVTGTANIIRNGDLILLQVPNLSGTSNSTACTLTGLPAAYRPARTQQVYCPVQDNGTLSMGQASIATSGTITLSKSDLTGTFTGSGTKGIINGTLAYALK